VPANAKIRFLAAFALPVALAVIWLLAVNKPVEGGLFPPCLFHLATGLHCPGCGGTRAAHLLLHGDLLGALRQNVFFVAVLPLAALYIFSLTRFAATGVWKEPIVSGKKATTIIAVLVIGFAILRNLPGFEFLAPTPLR